LKLLSYVATVSEMVYLWQNLYKIPVTEHTRCPKYSFAVSELLLCKENHMARNVAYN